jgi:hypothetical protein
LISIASAAIACDSTTISLALSGSAPEVGPQRLLIRRSILRDTVRMLVIDAANVIGSRPTGWWRDRPGATRVFAQRVRATVSAGQLDPPVTIVLEGRARAGADEANVDGVEVVHAPGEGDDMIAAIAEANRDVVVVTADRQLAGRVRAAAADVVGPSWLLDQLVD